MKAFKRYLAPSFRLIFKNIWAVMFLLLVVYMVYQTMFAWSHAKAAKPSSSVLPDDRVIFLTIQEKRYGANKIAFDSLLNRLQTWRFDQKNKQVYFKFEPQLPKSNSKIAVIYDRGFDSFERYTDVFSVISFPYQYNFKNQPLATFYNIASDGSVYFEFKGKRIKLDAGGTYRGFSFEGFQAVETRIDNYGVYNRTQFHKMADDPKNAVSTKTPS